MKVFLLILSLASISIQAQELDPSIKIKMDEDRARFEKELQEKYSIQKSPTHNSESYIQMNPHVFILSVSDSVGQDMALSGPAYAYTFNKYFELGGSLPFSWLVWKQRKDPNDTIARGAYGLMEVRGSAFLPMNERASVMFSLAPALVFMQNPDDAESTNIKVGWGTTIRPFGVVLRYDTFEIASGIDYFFAFVNDYGIYGLDAMSGNVDFRFRF